MSACRGYANIWDLECMEKGHINRPASAKKQQRRANKLNTNNWFRKTFKAQQQPKNAEESNVHHKKKMKAPEMEAVMFCPYTPNSQLKKDLTAAEAFLTRNQKEGRVRFVERLGPK